MLSTIRIFISSPGDVYEEREKAEAVVESLQRFYGGIVTLEIVMWEHLALDVDLTAQESIEKAIFPPEKAPDIAVFILWSRLGSELSEKRHLKSDGTPYRSGTEHEFHLMLQIRERSGGTKPHILAYHRNDQEAFFSQHPTNEMLEQHKLAKHFIEEQFMDEKGRNIRGLVIYDRPVSFAQRLHSHIRQKIDEILALKGNNMVTRWTESPYRSLSVFDMEHAPIFYGREEEIHHALDVMRSGEANGCSFTLIIGASGSGKSSLARAGVAANLMHHSFDEAVKEWRTASFVPGLSSRSSSQDGERIVENLFIGLAECLAEALPSLQTGSGGLDRFVCRLRGEGGEATDLMHSALEAASVEAGGAVHLLLLIDQLEELWTTKKSNDKVLQRFFKTLKVLASCEGVRVLSTLRSDFFSQAQEYLTPIYAASGQSQIDLTSPDTTALQRLIAEPARLAGISFERDEKTGRTLDQKILEEAAQDPGALPLLQYALGELYEHRDELKRELTFAAYNHIGGVEGAIGRRAEKLYNELHKDNPEEYSKALGEILPLLVTVGIHGEKSAVRQRPPLNELLSNSTQKALTNALIEARFLVTDESNGFATVTLTHEALLTRWNTLALWIAENQSLLQTRSRIEFGEARWRESDQDPSLLIPNGLPLQEARQLLSDGAHLVSNSTAEFINQSIAAATKTQKRKRMQIRLVGSFLVIATIVSVGTAVYATHKAQSLKQEQQKTADLAESQSAMRKEANSTLGFMLHDLASLTSDYGRTDLLENLLKRAETYNKTALEGLQDEANLLLAAGILREKRELAFELGQEDVAHEHLDSQLAVFAKLPANATIQAKLRKLDALRVKAVYLRDEGKLADANVFLTDAEKLHHQLSEADHNDIATKTAGVLLKTAAAELAWQEAAAISSNPVQEPFQFGKENQTPMENSIVSTEVPEDKKELRWNKAREAFQEVIGAAKKLQETSGSNQEKSKAIFSALFNYSKFLKTQEDYEGSRESLKSCLRFLEDEISVLREGIELQLYLAVSYRELGYLYQRFDNELPRAIQEFKNGLTVLSGIEAVAPNNANILWETRTLNNGLRLAYGKLIANNEGDKQLLRFSYQNKYKHLLAALEAARILDSKFPNSPRWSKKHEESIFDYLGFLGSDLNSLRKLDRDESHKIAKQASEWLYQNQSFVEAKVATRYQRRLLAYAHASIAGVFYANLKEYELAAKHYEIGLNVFDLLPNSPPSLVEESRDSLHFIKLDCLMKNGIPVKEVIAMIENSPEVRQGSKSLELLVSLYEDSLSPPSKTRIEELQQLIDERRVTSFGLRMETRSGKKVTKLFKLPNIIRDLSIAENKLNQQLNYYASIGFYLLADEGRFIEGLLHRASNNNVDVIELLTLAINQRKKKDEASKAELSNASDVWKSPEIAEYLEKIRMDFLKAESTAERQALGNRLLNLVNKIYPDDNRKRMEEEIEILKHVHQQKPNGLFGYEKEKHLIALDVLKVKLHQGNVKSLQPSSQPKVSEDIIESLEIVAADLATFPKGPYDNYLEKRLKVLLSLSSRLYNSPLHENASKQVDLIINAAQPYLNYESKGVALRAAKILSQAIFIGLRCGKSMKIDLVSQVLNTIPNHVENLEEEPVPFYLSIRRLEAHTKLYSSSFFIESSYKSIWDEIVGDVTIGDLVWDELNFLIAEGQYHKNIEELKKKFPDIRLIAPTLSMLAEWEEIPLNYPPQPIIELLDQGEEPSLIFDGLLERILNNFKKNSQALSYDESQLKRGLKLYFNRLIAFGESRLIGFDKDDFTDEQIVVLLSGFNNFGDKIYNYISMPFGRYDQLRKAIRGGGKFDIRKFGEVVAAGKGMPSAEVKAEMASEFKMIAFPSDGKVDTGANEPETRTSEKEVSSPPPDETLALSSFEDFLNEPTNSEYFIRSLSLLTEQRKKANQDDRIADEIKFSQKTLELYQAATKANNIALLVDSKEAQDRKFASKFSSLGFNQIKGGDFESAYRNTLKAMEIHPSVWAEGNYAHALLFTHQWEKAKEIYLRNRGKKIEISGKLDWETITAQDFKEFRGAGQVHPKMGEVEELLGIKLRKSPKN